MAEVRPGDGAQPFSTELRERACGAPAQAPAEQPATQRDDILGEAARRGLENAAERTIAELWAKREAGDLLVRISGQVVHIRRKSHLLAFVDIREPGDPSVGADGRVTAVCKCEALSAEGMRWVRNNVRLGDLVELVGLAQSVPSRIPSLLALRLRVQSRWIGAHPKAVFVPQPLGARAFGAPAADVGANGEGAPDEQPRANAPSAAEPPGAAPAEWRAQEAQQGWCVHWVSTGRCHVVGCAFAHEIPPCGRAAWLREYRRARALRGSCADDPHAVDDKQRSSQRAEVLAQWLVETYGAERLRAGTGVLDVAGGRGDVAFALHTLRGIRTTVIDPRPAQPRKEHRRYVRDHAHATLAAHVVARFDAAFARSDEHGALVRGASLIVGMHPDQATGAIVETAVAMRLPFCVVPCCVFASHFPDRRRPSDGRPVSSYEDLLQWLGARTAPGETRSGFLNFGGKNRVVYALGYHGDGDGGWCGGGSASGEEEAASATDARTC